MWPYDPASTATIAVSAAAILGATRRGFPMAVRVALVLLAALIIRVDAARQHSLHIWDESYHAVVATRLIEHPLTPTLYERPPIERDPVNWTEGHVWLHKPPLAMWAMALSMAAFGIDEVVMRAPSVIWSTLGVLLVFAIGRRLYNERVGLLAAGFQAVSGLLVSLASGRRVADHVDTALITCVELAVWVLVAGRGQSRWRDAAAGAAMGAGVLAKSVPALVVVPIALAAWSVRRGPRGASSRMVWLIAGAALVCGPWIVYSRLAFPLESQSAWLYTLRHITSVVEGQGGPWWTYLRDLPRLYGELIYLPAIWICFRLVLRAGVPADRLVVTWLAVPYAVFSAMATKMPAFVAIGAPALFLIEALFWLRVREHLSSSGSWRRPALALLLTLLTVLPARGLLAPTGPLERRDRRPGWAEELRHIDSRISSPNAVIFNVPNAMQAMFHSRHDIYARLPTDAEVRALQESRTPIVIYVPAGSLIAVPDDWRAIVLHATDAR